MTTAVVRAPGPWSGRPRQARTISLDPAVWEAIDETAQALTMSRSKLVEVVMGRWLTEYEMDDPK